MAKYTVHIGIGLVGCDREIAEIDSDEIMDEESWSELSEESKLDELYDYAGDLAGEYLEVYIREVEE